MTEDRLIEKIARAIPSVRAQGGRGIALGIGDDAAVLESRRGSRWVVSCDAFLEGVHFLMDRHPADSIGYKALQRAASDLVGMGAKPAYFLLTLALPPERSGHWLDEFLRGMRRAASNLEMRLIGGDTTNSKLISANLTVFGHVERGRAVRRSGARPGDLIYVSGTLGRAQLGLELVRAGCTGGRALASLLAPHLYPRIRVDLGRWLARNGIASAMMDLSDGLSTDLARLCRASGVGAKLWAERIPAVSIPPKIANLLVDRRSSAPAGRSDFDARRMALDGGDDYELLFTVPRRNERKLRDAPESSALTCIGETRRDRRVVLTDRAGRNCPLVSGGWDPFRK
jgi:thiamine-monophosphate kinase